MPASASRRVAIITHVAQLSGAELALWRLARFLDHERYEPVVVTFAEGPLVDRLEADGISCTVVPLAVGVAGARRDNLLSPAAVRQSGAAIAFVPRLVKALRGLDVDLLHTHSLKADLISVALAPLVRVPIVWHVHDRISDDYLPATVTRVIQSLARRVPRHVVANSTSTLQSLLPLPRGWTVAYPGLDPADFLPAITAGSARPNADAEPVIGILGRIGPTKGQDLFLRAAATVLMSHPQVRFRIIGTALFGEQDFERSLRELSRELGIADRVEFAGFVNDPAMALRALTICVHASPVPEPFGQVIVEAMAVGVPTVVTDAGGAAEIVRDEGLVIARLAAPGSVGDLADGMCWVLENPAAAAEMSALALDSVRRRFGIARTAEAVMNAWDRVR